MGTDHVILTCINGPAKGASYEFDQPRQCIMGRAPDCDIQLTGSVLFANVSRRHCELDIDPPHVRVRDLGSRNGTWLNGARIEQVGPYLEDEIDRQPGDFVPMQDGDQLRVGDVTFQLSVTGDARAREGAREAVHVVF
jgi:serine/threonine-protein kinase